PQQLAPCLLLPSREAGALTHDATSDSRPAAAPPAVSGAYFRPVLAPADIRKEGSAFDLPIALGVLAATEQISTERLDKVAVLGELGLEGAIRPVRGALPVALA